MGSASRCSRSIRRDGIRRRRLRPSWSFALRLCSGCRASVAVSGSARTGAADKIPVRRHRMNTPLDARAQLFQLHQDLLRIEAVDQGVVAARDDVLPYHDREPTDHRKQLGVLAEDAAVAAKKIDLLQQ